MTLFLRAYVTQDVIRAWRLVLFGSYLYRSVLGFCLQKSQCSLFSCPSVIERLKHSVTGLVSPVRWRIPVQETQRRWRTSSYFSYLLRNPYLLKESAHSPGGWMRWRKLIACSGLIEAVVPVGLQFMDLMARRTSRRGIGVG